MIQRNLYDELAKLYTVLFHNYGRCGISLKIIKLHEEKSHVASKFFESKSHTTCRIQLVGPCVTGIRLLQTKNG